MQKRDARGTGEIIYISIYSIAKERGKDKRESGGAAVKFAAQVKPAAADEIRPEGRAEGMKK